MIFASYLDLWLKRCVDPSMSRECLTSKNLYHAIWLASGWSIGLLLATVCRILGGLRAFFQHFIRGHNASPRVKMPYAYLMAWVATHYKGLMSGRIDDDRESSHSLWIWRKAVKILIYSETRKTMDLTVHTCFSDSFLIWMLLILGISFVTWVHYLLEYSGGCNVSARHILCPGVVMFENYRHIF